MIARLSSHDRIGWAALLIGSGIICFSSIIVRLTDVGPLASAAWRMTMAVPVLALWAITARAMAGEATAAPRPIRRRTALLLVVVAGAAFAGDVAAFHQALARTSIANAMFIGNISPIFSVIGGRIFFGERVRREVWAALALSLFGGWVMSGFATPASFSTGDLFALVAAIFFTAYVLAIKRVRSVLDGATATLASAAISAILLWIALVVLGIAFMPGSAQGWIAVIALGALGHAGGQGLTSVALGRLPVGPIALIMLTQSPVSAALAYFILGETMNVYQLCGGVLILVALAISRPR